MLFFRPAVPGACVFGVPAKNDGCPLKINGLRHAKPVESIGKSDHWQCIFNKILVRMRVKPAVYT
tara:strand:- start:234 stop:428 length:195 start_codon:yes stop_codon:yes gene_type:complete